MSKVKRTFVDTEYGQTHLRIYKPENPSKLPLVCLHQSPKSGREFAKFMASFGDERILIAPDYPGYGESDRPPSEPPVTISNYARNMWQVVDSLKLGKVHLFGNHTGSCVATEMAYMRPNDVGSIVMVSAMILTEEETERMLANYNTIPLDAEGTRFSHIWQNIKKYRSPGMTLEMMSESFAENLRGGEAYEWGHYAAYNYCKFFAERISQLPHRITVINPGDMVYEFTARVEPYLQNGELVDRPGWENYIVNIQMDEVVILVKEVLSQ